MKNKKMLGNILLTLTALIWGTAFVAQRIGMDSIEPITFNAVRMALAACATGSVAFFRMRRKSEKATPGRRRTMIAGGICCGIFLSAASIFQQMGLVTTTAGKAGFITAMYILIVPVVNFIIFGKKNPWIVWIAVLIGVAGMYLLCVKEGLQLTKGDLLVCICAFLFSGHILCCDHFVKHDDPVCLSAIQFLTVSVITAALAFIFESPSWTAVRLAAIPILYCGLISGGVGYTLQIVAQRYTDPATASLLMSLESVFAALSGALVLNEKMSGRELLGCVIIFAAVTLVQIPVEPSGKR